MEMFFLLLIAVAAVGLIVWHSSRSQDVLGHWARENDYRIIEAKYAHLKGPFFWTASKGQSVYRVTVQDQTGRTRSGWVRCGSWWFGIWSDHADVRWDDEGQ